MGAAVQSLSGLLLGAAAAAVRAGAPSLPYPGARLMGHTKVAAGDFVLYPACNMKTEAPYIEFDPILPPIAFNGGQALLPFVRSRVWPEIQLNNGWVIHIEAFAADGRPATEDTPRGLSTPAHLYWAPRVKSHVGAPANMEEGRVSPINPPESLRTRSG